MTCVALLRMCPCSQLTIWSTADFPVWVTTPNFSPRLHFTTKTQFMFLRQEAAALCESFTSSLSSDSLLTTAQFLSSLLRVRRHSVIHWTHPCLITKSSRFLLLLQYSFTHLLHTFTTLNWDAKERLATTNWNFPASLQGWLNSFQIKI